MQQKGFHRRLTAILSADVAGYSRLMQDDEAATVSTLESYKQAFFDLIRQHRGRVVDSPGDNLLAEFASVVDAVQCAVAVQKEFHAHNAELPENRRMLFRIGVNLGDVIEEGERIYGDGVNIAARLESIADPGGICVSKTAFDHIESKLPLGYEFLGEQTVKNIAKPVGAYRVVLESRITESRGARPTAQGARQRTLAFGLAGALLIIAGAVLWQFVLRPAPTPPARPPVEKADPQKMVFPLPDKPSIAVLPFENMSEDKDFDYFSDGLTEEIINGLSKVEHVFVIARNSTFTYKGKPVKVQQVAEEMGVRYVLEGSVRKTGDKVRITTQLVDALNGRHIFSERYDRDFKDILTVQDEITMSILVALQVALTKGEMAQLFAKGTKNLDAYLKFLKSMQLVQQFNAEGLALARRYAEEAIALDPWYAMSYFALSTATLNETIIGANKLPRTEALQQALELAQKAAALEPSSSTHYLLGIVYNFLHKPEKALAEAEKAITLGPNDALAYDCMGAALLASDRFHDAIPMFQKSLRLSPIPRGAVVLLRLGAAHRFIGQHEEAIVAFKKALQLYPDNLLGHAYLAATYANVGRDAEARGEAAEVLRINPNFSAERLVKGFSIRNKTLLDQMVTDLRKAGLN